MKSCRHRQKTRDANITDGNWAPFFPEWVAVTRLWKWKHNVLSTLSLVVRLALPTWGLLSIFFLGKSHTYQFSLAKKYSEENLVWTGDGLMWAVTGAQVSHPLAPPARQHPMNTVRTATHLAYHSLGLGPGPH